MRLLETSGLTKKFGGLTVMNDLDFYIEEGEIKGFLGPNGAGKSTFFNLITGVHSPTSGHIIYGGKDITKAKPHQVAKMGIGRTFQLNPLFGDFTVFENVTAAYHMRPHSTIGQVFFNTKTYRENETYIAKSADEILEFLGLSHVRNELAKNLPHGYQKILGVARALAAGRHEPGGDRLFHQGDLQHAGQGHHGPGGGAQHADSRHPGQRDRHQLRPEDL